MFVVVNDPYFKKISSSAINLHILKSSSLLFTEESISFLREGKEGERRGEREVQSALVPPGPTARPTGRDAGQSPPPRRRGWLRSDRSLMAGISDDRSVTAGLASAEQSCHPVSAMAGQWWLGLMAGVGDG